MNKNKLSLVLPATMMENHRTRQELFLYKGVLYFGAATNL